ncbi:FAD-binding oxidoreductase [Pararhizobium sp. BT-229]|uniref:NAD(P)/FAD-dependent oxidoreductase n=1 Tax=Pararhizobium sp. BT-229 TaxID=2986923 RepID=UPI0021F72207|nr:FAD-dependent oxidoreductase [Pararhizobium sp. BT-229]MCV9967847.1 FAD-binding oxidoreductase [Pararhizobium sp. BT-229]
MQRPSMTALAEVKMSPFWLDRRDAPEVLPPLTSNRKPDLLIVGGGFTGLWGAIQAKQNNPGLDVVLIEKGAVANGASGRPGGVVSTSVMHGLSNAVRVFPNDIAELERLGKENMHGFMQTIADHGIDCHAEWGGELTVAVDDDHIEALHREHELHLEYGHKAVFLDQAAVQAQIRSPRYKAGIWSKDISGTVHPALLAWGLKKAALSLGVEIFENTELLAVDEVGGKIQVSTRFGLVTARKVLLATNAFTSGHPRIKRRVVAIRDRVLATEPLSQEQMHAVGWTNRQGVYDTRTQMNYMRLTKDNRIIFGGRLAYAFAGSAFPSADTDVQSYQPLAAAFFDTFPQLEGVRFTHAWSGPIDLSTRMAVHFQRYHAGKVVYAGGYSGFGVSASRFGARIALDILDGSKTAESRLDFATTLPNTIPPEPFRWLGAQVTMYALDTADKKGGWRKPWLRLVSAMGFPLS